MAAIYKVEPPPILHYRRQGVPLNGNHNQRGTFRCSASAQGNHNRETPQLLRTAVSGVTEFLRLLSPKKKSEICEGKEVPLVCGIDDVVSVLRSDYEQAYFLTGNFTSEIYSENCLFEDPTIKFRGKALYLQNLELLVPFFDLPSLALENIEQVVNNEKTFVLTSWKLRTYLKLPWRPLISIDGTTIYDLDEKCKIVRHAESWNISALEAIGQIFKPSGRVMNE